ncbi:glycosyl transferase [Pseudoalteromonas phenolica]|uniref:Glycosyl transferase n=1 Tax=Pseudoalteromonas phenolica TaxID=161398 RepID=A0A4Q7ISX9_9GAMM|nr:glycosyltransferase family 2 protein [Pseudoalteromonas phenolica]RZQ54965.1 glycosyl transferase [Pseudoalteromonas phenolica]
MILFFWLLVLLLVFPLVLYPISLWLISKFYPSNDVELSKSFEPEIAVIISAYNEELIIEKKLDNILECTYPKNKIRILVASDGSNDKTNDIVLNFAKKHSDFDIKLVDVPGRGGKTLAQNYVVNNFCDGLDVLVFTDANSMLRSDALKYLINRFKSDSVGYVSGQLQYCNSTESNTSESESTYWNFDLKLREWESAIGSTVGGNGALYAIRRDSYVNLPALLSHDGFMPTKVVLQGKTAKFEPLAVAVEKAGAVTGDEFKRKVRMQRGQPWKKYYDYKKFNFFKYGWFSYFYIGHKYLKYQLYVLHPTLFIVNYLIYSESVFYLLAFIGQVVFYLLALVGFITESKGKLFYYPYYYCMTVYAQLIAVKNTLTGKTSVTWESIESTRVE